MEWLQVIFEHQREYFTLWRCYLRGAQMEMNALICLELDHTIAIAIPSLTRA